MFSLDNKKMFQNVAEYLAGYSDLELASFKVRVVERKRTRLRVRALIRNREPSYSCSSSMTLFLSRNDTIDPANDTLLKEIHIPQIAADQNLRIKIEFRFPPDIKRGNWHVIARINAGGKAREFELENNTLLDTVFLPRN